MRDVGRCSFVENKPYRIAVVDDEPKITRLLKLVLEENLNCQVETFNDPTTALKRLETQQFDAISLDHRMPVLTGMDLVKMLRTTPGPNRASKILLLTGFRDEAECVDVSLLENLIFLEKPVQDIRYVRWIKVLLESKPWHKPIQG